MAPFNKRQIGYIQAVAGRQQHTTLVCGNINRQLHSDHAAKIDTNGSGSTTQTTLKVPCVQKAIGGVVLDEESDYGDSKTLFLQNYVLDRAELGFDSRNFHNNNRLEWGDFVNLKGVHFGFGNTTEFHCFVAPCRTQTEDAIPQQGGVTMYELNPDILNSTERATPDGYLHSTDVRFRFTLPANRSSSTATGSGLFPSADQLGITNTVPSQGITVSQYNDFVKGMPTSSDSFDFSTVQAMINQYNATHPMGQDHFEFRWIVWRAKNPTFHRSADSDIGENTKTNMDAIRDGVSLRNPGYDLFVGQTGRKRGFLGYTHNAKLDQNKDPDDLSTERYSGKYVLESDSNQWANPPTFSALQPTGEVKFTVDDLLTMRLNRDDYVIMKDVRFFLGKEHGKSHFEDTLHWDWNDPIDTPHSNVLSSPTLNDKNFRWHMTLIGTSGGKNPVVLNEHVRWTTKMTSG